MNMIKLINVNKPTEITGKIYSSKFFENITKTIFVVASHPRETKFYDNTDVSSKDVLGIASNFHVVDEVLYCEVKWIHKEFALMENGMDFTIAGIGEMGNDNKTLKSFELQHIFVDLLKAINFDFLDVI